MGPINGKSAIGFNIGNANNGASAVFDFAHKKVQVELNIRHWVNLLFRVKRNAESGFTGARVLRKQVGGNICGHCESITVSRNEYMFNHVIVVRTKIA